MKKTLWNAENLPIETTLDRVLYDIRKDDADGLLLDVPTFDDIYEDSDGVITLDALIVPFQKLESKTNALVAVMKRTGTEVTPINTTISSPFMARGVANVSATIELSDGQAVTIFFHNPDVNPKKIQSTDDLISWKWLLNKKDITIVVAPEKGVDLNVRQVAVRIMKLAQKNSAAFLRANTKSAERKAVIDGLKTEITDLEAELKDAQNRLEVARVEKDDREIAALTNPPVAPVAPEVATPTLNGFSVSETINELNTEYGTNNAVWNASVAEVQALSESDYQDLIDALKNANYNSNGVLLKAKRSGKEKLIEIAQDVLDDHEKTSSISPENSFKRMALEYAIEGKEGIKKGRDFVTMLREVGGDSRNESADELERNINRLENPESTPELTEPTGDETPPIEIETGAFGQIFREFYHDAQGAIAKLTEMQTGEAVAALHHPDVGDIDLVWGKEGTGASDGYGLSKLIKFHPEVISDLQGVISSLSKVSETSSNKRIQLESKDHKAAVRLEWNGEQKAWLLTAFEKVKVGDSTRADIADVSNEDGTARFTSNPDETIPQPAENTIAPDETENVGQNEVVEQPEFSNKEILKGFLTTGNLSAVLSFLKPLNKQDLVQLLLETGFSISGSKTIKEVMDFVSPQLVKAASLKTDGYGLRTPETESNEDLQDLKTKTATPEEITEFVTDIAEGKQPKASRLVVNVASHDKNTKVKNMTSIDIGVARELLIPSAAIHVKNRHPDMDVSDWLYLPEFAEKFDAVVESETVGEQKMPRLVFIKNRDGLAYVYVADLATGKRQGDRLNVVTYFKDKPKTLIENLKKNGVKQQDAESVLNALFFNDESSLSQAYSQRSEEGDSSDQLTASSENIPQPPENSTAEIDAVASLKGFEIKSDSATGSVEYTKGLVKVNYQATNDAGISDGAYAIFVDGKRVYDGYMGIKRNGFSEPEYVFNKALDLLNQSTGTELSEIDLETSDNAPETLITAPNGSDDFGEITPEQADLMGGSAGKIKLQLGFHDDKTGRGFGKIHIDRDIRAEQLKANGYDSTEDLIFDVAQNKNAIFQGKGNTFILAKNNGKAKIAFVQVKQGDGGVFYSVGSGLISRADYLKNKALLWERAQSNQIDNNPPSAVTGEKQSSDENIPQPPQNTITEIDTEIESLKSETDRKVFDKRLDDLAAMIEERDLMEQYDPQLNELADILTEILKKAAAGVM